jgi:hypothetical protein
MEEVTGSINRRKVEAPILRLYEGSSRKRQHNVHNKFWSTTRGMSTEVVQLLIPTELYLQQHNKQVVNKRKSIY